MTGPGRTRTLRIPGILPSEDWVHMALQVRADGEASLVLDRQPVGSSPATLRMDDAGPWFLLIQGDAVGTEIYVRNLAIWPGERYGPEADP